MLGGSLGTTMDHTFFFFPSKKTNSGKPMRLSEVLVTSQHKLNMSYDITRFPTPFLWIHHT